MLELRFDVIVREGGRVGIVSLSDCPQSSWIERGGVWIIDVMVFAPEDF